MLACYRPSPQTEQTSLACKELEVQTWWRDRGRKRLKHGKNGRFGGSLWQLLHFAASSNSPLRCAGLFHLFAESFGEWGEIQNFCNDFPSGMRQLSRGCCSECSAKMADLFTGRRPDQFFTKCQMMTKLHEAWFLFELPGSKLPVSLLDAVAICSVRCIFLYVLIMNLRIYIYICIIWSQCDLCAR